MPLRLDYRGTTTLPVEIEGLTPTAVRELPLAQIEQFEIFHGNQKLPLAELFHVSGSPRDERFELTGNLAGVHWIGAGMSSGEIHIASDAGRHLGSEMTGGAIHVQGSAGDWLGAEMHGGSIRVQGSTGHLVGAAYRGGRRGMTGGSILVDGHAGNEVGHTMRRGLIAIGGDCGDFAGVGMIAGTVLVLGKIGLRPAAGMRRGTVGLLGSEPAKLLPTFRRGCLFEPLALRLVLRQLATVGFAVSDEVLAASYRIYHGDTLTTGRGEVLVREMAGA